MALGKTIYGGIVLPLRITLLQSLLELQTTSVWASTRQETVKSFGGLAAASNGDTGRVDANFTAPEMDPTEDKEALDISEDLSSDVESMPVENLDMCHVYLDVAS